MWPPSHSLSIHCLCSEGSLSLYQKVSEMTIKEMNQHSGQYKEGLLDRCVCLHCLLMKPSNLTDLFPPWSCSKSKEVGQMNCQDGGCPWWHIREILEVLC